MLKKTKIVSVALVVVAMVYGSAFAADYQGMSNDELVALRASMREASQEERDAFRSEWQNRVNSMGQEDRGQAVNRPEGAVRAGAGNWHRKGNHSQNRQMSQSGKSGSYGMGGGGGQGMGRGGGRGRR